MLNKLDLSIFRIADDGKNVDLFIYADYFFARATLKVNNRRERSIKTQLTDESLGIPLDDTLVYEINKDDVKPGDILLSNGCQFLVVGVDPAYADGSIVKVFDINTSLTYWRGFGRNDKVYSLDNYIYK